MKRLLLILMAAVLALPCLVLSVGAATPQNAMIATTREAVEAAVGTDTAGAAVVLLEAGSRTMLEGFGYDDIEGRTVVSAETAFELGELSSLFVMAAVLRLEAEERLSLDADVTDYLPKAFVEQLGLSHETTLRHLLYGMAGFEGRGIDLRFEKPSHCFDTLEEALLSQVPAQSAASGLYHNASAFGIGLAAYAVECVAGVPYADYVTQQILGPLGMTSTLPDPRKDSEIAFPAKGHLTVGEGRFAVAVRDGRSYGGIWPANGAISTAADMSVFLQFVLSDPAMLALLSETDENGIFAVGVLDSLVSGNVRVIEGASSYFGACVAIDPIARWAALVMTNGRESSLLALPRTLGGVTLGVTVESADAYQPVDTEKLEGAFADASLERSGFLGRLSVKENAVKLTDNGDGTVSFGGQTLKQIARGVFADAEKGDSVAVLQALYTVEGELIALLHADGTTYLPVSFFEQGAPATVLYVLVVLLALFFLAGGVLKLLARLIRRGEHSEPWRFVFPWIFAAVFSLLVLLQLRVGETRGVLAMAGFFEAMTLLCLLFAVATTVSLILALFTAFTKHGRTARVARCAIAFLALFFLCGYWKLIVI